MPQKGLTKGDGAWGSGKKLSSKVFSRFPENNKPCLTLSPLSAGTRGAEPEERRRKSECSR